MTDNKEIVRRIVEEAYSAGNLDVLDECCAQGYVDHDAFGGDLDVEGEKELVRAYRGAFPDLKVEIMEMIGEGDLIACHWRSTGTHEGELGGIEPSGRHLETEGLFMARCSDGQLVEGWTMYDTLGFVRRLRQEEAGAEERAGEGAEAPS